MRAKPEPQGTLLVRGGWDCELVDALKPQPGTFMPPKLGAQHSSTLNWTACPVRAESKT